MSKGFFIDVTRCIACRACQIACKQWNRLPAEQTKNFGSYQNPPDFTPTTYKLVRMKEAIVNGKFYGLFFPDQCRHCRIPPCLLWAQDEEAIYQDDDTGAVVYTPETSRLKAENVIAACPYDVPRRDDSGRLNKCTMCIDRVNNGMDPACVKTCPTGTMNFGELEDMQTMATERLEMVKRTHPQAQLIDEDNVRVIFLTAFAPEKYHRYSAAFDAKRWKARQPFAP